MTYKITQPTAERTLRTLEHFDGDLSRATHDVWIGLQSLGSYTDRKAEAVYELLTWLGRRPNRQAELLNQLRVIAAPPVQG